MSSPVKAPPRTDAASPKPVAASRARAPRLQRKCACGGSSSGECESCKKKPRELLQRKAAVGGSSPAPAPRAASVVAKPSPLAVKPPAVPAPRGAAMPTPAKPAAPPLTEKKEPIADSAKVPPIVRRALDTAGQPLDPVTRSDMEARFGRSFANVRIHSDALAAESARAVHAHAYTVGQDIVFDAGQYQPKTPEGLQLLAHELAHTVQQHGLQKSSGEIAMDSTGEYQHLEGEAERISTTVMQLRSAGGAPLSAGRISQRTLSRATKSRSKTPLQDAESKKDKKDSKDQWVEVEESSELGKAGVAQISRSPADPGLIAVVMRTPFLVPAEKGPSAVSLWDAQAKAGALQAIMAPGATQPKTTTGLKQERPNTDALRDIWLLKMHWNKESAPTLWKEAAKKAGSSPDEASFLPSTKTADATCDFDHILELQFGGNNIPANLQTLDSSPNRSSGSQIGQFLKSTAFAIRNALAKEAAEASDANAPKPDLAAIRIEYKSAVLSPDTVACHCCAVEAAAAILKLKDEQKGGSTGTPYPMKSGAFTVCVLAGDDNPLKLRGSDVPENKAASTLVPGLQLLEWHRPAKGKQQPTCDTDEAATPESPEKAAGASSKPAAKGKAGGKGASQAGGEVTAVVDPTSRILEKLKVQEGQSLKLSRDPSGRLTAPEKDPRLAFAIDYLSDGVIHKLKIGDDGSVSGSGTIIPSAPFLPKPIEVSFDKDQFVMTTDVKKPHLPIPGVEITESKIGLQIAPEFKPEGKVGFKVAPGGKTILHGDLTVSGDESGLVVSGDVFASIPGIDEAKGNLLFKDHQWSGGIDIKADDFKGKLKYVKSGEVSIKFSQAAGMSASGSVDLEVPGVSNPVRAEVSYHQGRGWTYRGEAEFNPPRLKPVKIRLEYADGHLSGTGKTGFEFHSLTGEIEVSYRDEQFSGEGSLGIKTERAEGNLKVAMHPRPQGPPVFTGEGSVSYKITPNLIATAGIKIDEHEKVQFTGELVFPKPIDLFDGFHGNYTFFTIRLPIPIPGASIGGIGLKAVITGELSAGYDVGPVQLLDTKAKASFQPLEKDPQLEMELSSRVHIKASVHVTGSISGDLEIDAVIASVSGGLTVSATAELAGAMDLPVSAHYKEGKVQADIDFHVSLALAILLGLSAHVRAKAGIGWLSVSTEKVWELGSYKYDPGLNFGMSLKRPIHYATGEGLQLPSISDINWITPDINVGDALEKIFHRGEQQEHEV
jgi:hypothetical protein